MPDMLERAVPRYTSYPTAPNFNSTVDANVYGRWLADLSGKSTLSIYLHVPYCRDLCLYCGCNTKATHKSKPIEIYAKLIAEEIGLVAHHTGRRKVTHMHWGGGTPSIFGVDQLKFVAAELSRHFDLSAVREHAIELDPRYLTPAIARTLRDIGINRASFGVQDFSPLVQQAVGRIQPFNLVKDAIAMLREFGIDSINLDLMYGLPRQTTSDLRQTAILAHALQPNRIAVFGYAHVPWFRPQQKLIDEAELPSARERMDQAAAAYETFTQLGYEPIGLDHYARPDDQMVIAAKTGLIHRNFQGYTIDDADALIGLGASSISRLPGGFAQNSSSVGGYSRAMAARKLATAKGIAISTDDRARGRIIERLMCDMAVDLATTAGIFGIDVDRTFSDALTSLEPLMSDGSLQIDGQQIRITEKGRPFARVVASAFDSYLIGSQARHSRAV
jgi:oxygen-independent coproporphyrinogen III oxidase